MNGKEKKEKDESGKVSNCPNGSEEGEGEQEQENGIATNDRQQEMENKNKRNPRRK